METQKLNQSEFFGLMMLYAASIDGETLDKELLVIKDFLGEENYTRVTALYESMNDYELINFFRDHKDEHLRSATDETIFLSELKTVISADHEVDIMEKTLLLAFKKIMRE